VTKTVYRRARNYLIEEQGISSRFVNHVCITAEEAETLTAVLQQRPAGTVFEIGASVGLSTAVLAMAKPQKSRLIVVDPNLPVSCQPCFGSFLGAIPDAKCYEIISSLLLFMGAHGVTLIEGFFSCYPDQDIRTRLADRNIASENIRIFGKGIVDFAP
jgi:hypothetical protein